MVEELRIPFRDFYLFVACQAWPAPGVAYTYEELGEKGPRVQKARNKYRSSDAFLATTTNQYSFCSF